MNYDPKKEVALKLEKNGETVNKLGVLSSENRQHVRKDNTAKSKRIAATRKISKQTAFGDLEQLQVLLEANA